jgi:hypothetical protein
VVYELICEGSCNPNVAVVDRMAADVMADRTLQNAGFMNGKRHRPEDMVRLQRTLKYTPHLRCDYDPRFVQCGLCAAKRRFGA